MRHLEHAVRELLAAGTPLRDAKKEFERRYIKNALELAEANRTRAAQILGVHRNSIHNYLRGGK